METAGKVVHQTKARVFGGDTHVEGKILSVFETSTEVIRKGKASKPTEFGKMIKVQEAENRCHKSEEQIAEQLSGHWREDHLFGLQQAFTRGEPQARRQETRARGSDLLTPVS